VALLAVTAFLAPYSISVEDHRIETHRVTEVITNADGITAVRTKGDANNGSTSGPATIAGAKVDLHVATIPCIGRWKWSPRTAFGN
jgi:signal peptidase I